MKRHLTFSFIMAYLLTMIGFLVLCSTAGKNRLMTHKLEEQENLLYHEATLIADEYLQHRTQSFEDISDIIRNFDSIQTYLGIRIWLVNRDGIILSDTSHQTTVIGEDINEYNNQYLDFQLHTNESLQPLLADPSLSIVYPITSDLQLKGYVILHSPMSAIEENVMDSVNLINLCILIFFVFMALVFLLLGFSTIYPLRVLTRIAKEYAHGKYKEKPDMKYFPDYQPLAETLTYMADEITKQEDYQKHFIANISHDFRSPLTSIKGYAEALADGTIPYENQAKYLDIIIFETERLGKLTSNLLELSQYEKNGIPLELSVFDLCEIIKKTSETFEHACLEKDIKLHLSFDFPVLYVEADLGKIQQVLYNLIDNAIKFSHNDSTIDISTEENNGKAFVSVKDYGVGIPKEQQKRIWERFFKIDSSRGRDKKGTGLGLSIVKEIILAHNENINVISTEDVGTEFIFSLKCADS